MRTRNPLRGAAAAAALLASVLVPAATPAGAAPAAVHTQAVFNNPLGTPAEQRAVVDRQIELIEGAPAHARIRLAMYYADDPALPEALIAAHRRGVAVQAVFDSKAAGMAP